MRASAPRSDEAGFGGMAFGRSDGADMVDLPGAGRGCSTV
jgi:hypothetical protein